MTNKEKIIDILLEFYEEYQGNIPNRPMIPSIYASKIIDSLQEESVSIWHEDNHQPTMYRKYLVRYSDGRVSGSWERRDDGFIPWKDVVKEHGFTHWCYVEDLLKL